MKLTIQELAKLILEVAKTLHFDKDEQSELVELLQKKDLENLEFWLQIHSFMRHQFESKLKLINERNEKKLVELVKKDFQHIIKSYLEEKKRKQKIPKYILEEFAKDDAFAAYNKIESLLTSLRMSAPLNLETISTLFDAKTRRNRELNRHFDFAVVKENQNGIKKLTDEILKIENGSRKQIIYQPHNDQHTIGFDIERSSDGTLNIFCFESARDSSHLFTLDALFDYLKSVNIPFSITSCRSGLQTDKDNCSLFVYSALNEFAKYPSIAEYLPSEFVEDTVTKSLTETLTKAVSAIGLEAKSKPLRNMSKITWIKLSDMPTKIISFAQSYTAMESTLKEKKDIYPAKSAEKSAAKFVDKHQSKYEFDVNEKNKDNKKYYITKRREKITTRLQDFQSALPKTVLDLIKDNPIWQILSQTQDKDRAKKLEMFFTINNISKHAQLEMIEKLANSLFLAYGITSDSKLNSLPQELIENFLILRNQFVPLFFELGTAEDFTKVFNAKNQVLLVALNFDRCYQGEYPNVMVEYFQDERNFPVRHFLMNNNIGNLPSYLDQQIVFKPENLLKQAMFKSEEEVKEYLSVITSRYVDIEKRSYFSPRRQHAFLEQAFIACCHKFISNLNMARDQELLTQIQTYLDNDNVRDLPSQMILSITMRLRSFSKDELAQLRILRNVYLESLVTHTRVSEVMQEFWHKRNLFLLFDLDENLTQETDHIVARNLSEVMTSCYSLPDVLFPLSTNVGFYPKHLKKFLHVPFVNPLLDSQRKLTIDEIAMLLQETEQRFAYSVGNVKTSLLTFYKKVNFLDAYFTWYLGQTGLQNIGPKEMEYILQLQNYINQSNTRDQFNTDNNEILQYSFLMKFNPLMLLFNNPNNKISLQDIMSELNKAPSALMKLTWLENTWNYFSQPAVLFTMKNNNNNASDNFNAYLPLFKSAYLEVLKSMPYDPIDVMGNRNLQLVINKSPLFKCDEEARDILFEQIQACAQGAYRKNILPATTSESFFTPLTSLFQSNEVRDAQLTERAKKVSTIARRFYELNSDDTSATEDLRIDFREPNLSLEIGMFNNSKVGKLDTWVEYHCVKGKELNVSWKPNWKFNLAIEGSRMAEAVEIVMKWMSIYQVGVCKVKGQSHANNLNSSIIGREIVIYTHYNPKMTPEKWVEFITKIEKDLNEKGIKPSSNNVPISNRKLGKYTSYTHEAWTADRYDISFKEGLAKKNFPDMFENFSYNEENKQIVSARSTFEKSR